MIIVFVLLTAAVVISVVFTAMQMQKASALQKLLSSNKELLESYVSGKSFSDRQLEAIQATVDDFLLDRKEEAVNRYIEGVKSGEIAIPKELSIAVQTHQDRHYAEMQRIVSSKINRTLGEDEEIKELRAKNVELLDKIDSVKEKYERLLAVGKNELQSTADKLTEAVQAADSVRKRLKESEDLRTQVEQDAAGLRQKISDLEGELASVRGELNYMKDKPPEKDISKEILEYVKLIKRKGSGEKLSLQEVVTMGKFEQRVLQ